MRAEECLRRGLANGYKARVEKFRVPSLGKTANTHTHIAARHTHTHTERKGQEQEQGQMRGQRIKEKEKFLLL